MANVYVDLVDSSRAVDISSFGLPVVGIIVSGIFAVAASSLTIYLIYLHLSHFTRPFYQRHIVRILLMVPVYSVSAWCSYIWPHHILTFDLIRSCFEALVIYEFFQLLLAYLGDGDVERRRRLSGKRSRPLLPPFCCYSYDPSSVHFLMDARLLVNQYIMIRPLTTVIAVVMEQRGVFHADSLDPRHGNFWFMVMNFLSVSLAMFALFHFFTAVRGDI
eukprot:Partr_v1_DN25336_c1_g1_i1_m21511 putative transmembrane protein 184B